MGAVNPTGVKPAVRAAAARLRIDSATAEVLRAFDGKGVHSILLKGASNRQWLGETPAESRWYADCDLLVRPQHREEAARVLHALGFTPDFDSEQMPTWWRQHDLAWTRSDDEAVIDVHRTLPGVRVDDDRAWTVLSADAEQIIVGGHPARVLAIPARAMHLAIHAAQHGAEWSMGLSDLTRAIESADEQTWLAAAGLARELDATSPFVAGLCVLPPGQVLVERLGFATAARVDLALLDGNASALTVERFMHAGSLRTRLSMIWHKLFPPVTFLRHWSPLARRGRLGTLIAYAWRPMWVMVRALAAVRAWLRAHRLGGN